MSDAVELQLQLDYYHRQLEERDALVSSLRRNLDTVLSEAADTQLRLTTLKTVQDALLREKLLAERHVEQLMREKAELASENARLHVYAKDCAARAEEAVRVAAELRATANAKAAAEELSIAGVHETQTPSSESTSILTSQLTAARIIIARLLALVAEAGIELDRVALLAPPASDADPSQRALGRTAPALQSAIVAALGLSSPVLIPGPAAAGVLEDSRSERAGGAPSPSPRSSAILAAEAANLAPPGVAGWLAVVAGGSGRSRSGSERSSARNSGAGSASAPSAGDNATPAAETSAASATPVVSGVSTTFVVGGLTPLRKSGGALPRNPRGGGGGGAFSALSGLFSVLVGDVTDTAGLDSMLTPAPEMPFGSGLMATSASPPPEMQPLSFDAAVASSLNLDSGRSGVRTEYDEPAGATPPVAPPPAPSSMTGRMSALSNNSGDTSSSASGVAAGAQSSTAGLAHGVGAAALLVRSAAGSGITADGEELDGVASTGSTTGAPTSLRRKAVSFREVQVREDASLKGT